MLVQHNFTEMFSFRLETYLSKFEDILRTQLFHLVFMALEVTLQLLKGNSGKTD